MAEWEDVDRLALALPEAAGGTSYGNRAWTGKGRVFAWERPLRRWDREALGDAAPTGRSSARGWSTSWPRRRCSPTTRPGTSRRW